MIEAAPREVGRAWRVRGRDQHEGRALVDRACTRERDRGLLEECRRLNGRGGAGGERGDAVAGSQCVSLESQDIAWHKRRAGAEHHTEGKVCAPHAYGRRHTARLSEHRIIVEHAGAGRVSRVHSAPVRRLIEVDRKHQTKVVHCDAEDLGRGPESERACRAARSVRC